METLTLLQIHQAVQATNAPKASELQITGVCTDTRKITPGCVFIAIEGERFDGHNFITQAFDLGAVAAICHKPIVCDKPIIFVKNTRTALLQLAQFYRTLFPTTVVGVTGSVGKTSTKDMIHCVLNSAMSTYKTQGNLNNDIGVPLSLLELDRTHQAAVIEMGMSHFGEIELLAKTAQPNIGVITNIGMSHIENLGSRDNILKAKLELCQGLKDHAPLILNGDDDKLQTVSTTQSHPILYYGIDNTICDVKATNIVQKDGCTLFDITYYGKTIHAQLPLIGHHHVRNALAAFCVGLTCSLEPAAIVKAYATYKPSGMRQNLVQCGSFTVIEDCYNASPDSMRAALSVLVDTPCSGKKIAVLGDMLEMGDYSATAHTDVGTMVRHAKEISHLFCYGPDTAMIAKVAKRPDLNIYHTTDKDALYQSIASILQPGDLILFKASRAMRLEEVIQRLYDAFGKQNG